MGNVHVTCSSQALLLHKQQLQINDILTGGDYQPSRIQFSHLPHLFASSFSITLVPKFLSTGFQPSGA